jgi:molybdopterin molybdotransferase
MISVAKALSLVLQQVRVLGPETLDLSLAAERRLWEDLRAAVPYPLFDNAAVDGFALGGPEADARGPRRLKIATLLAAGRTLRSRLKRGETVKIMTGAALPAGAVAVLPRERVQEEAGWAGYTGPVARGSNVRRRGEDWRRGQLLLKAGTRLGPAQLALAVAAGVRSLRVARKPRISLLVTGSELLGAGAKLEAGKIYDSNTPLLAHTLQRQGFPLWRTRRVADRKAEVAGALRQALEDSDVLLISGGVSVGDKDFVKVCLEEAGVARVFWKVAQRPGKPLYFGVKGRQCVFGLPGNPVAAFVGLWYYVLPALRALEGDPAPRAFRVRARALAALPADRERAVFYRSRLRLQDGNWTARPQGAQGSHLLGSLAAANALLLVPAGSSIRRGAWVDAYPLEGADAY